MRPQRRIPASESGPRSGQCVRLVNRLISASPARTRFLTETAGCWPAAVQVLEVGGELRCGRRPKEDDHQTDTGYGLPLDQATSTYPAWPEASMKSV